MRDEWQAITWVGVQLARYVYHWRGISCISFVRETFSKRVDSCNAHSASASFGPSERVSHTCSNRLVLRAWHAWNAWHA